MKKLKDQQDTRDAEAKRRFEKTRPEALSEMKGLDFDNSGDQGMGLKWIERLFYEPAVVMRNDE
jgi:hypothetical protein